MPEQVADLQCRAKEKEQSLNKSSLSGSKPDQVVFDRCKEKGAKKGKWLKGSLSSGSNGADCREGSKKHRLVVEEEPRTDMDQWMEGGEEMYECERRERWGGTSPHLLCRDVGVVTLEAQ